MTAADLDVMLRQAVRRLVTGVAVVTVWHGDDVHGTTVSSVCSVSREPLLIGVCLRAVAEQIGDRQSAAPIGGDRAVIGE